MKIYFVRHGSTDAWENKNSQLETDGLSDKGKAQAKELTKRFANISLDLVISSPFARALQTAKEIRPEVIINDLFTEVRKPKEVRGKPREDNETKDILKKVYDMWLVDSSWHLSDEENFEDLKKRGLAALKFLESQNKENILVVSHATFLATLVGLMMLGENISVEILLHLKGFLRFANTGVSIFTYEGGKWKLQCWNDTSHCLE